MEVAVVVGVVDAVVVVVVAVVVWVVVAVDVSWHNPHAAGQNLINCSSFATPVARDVSPHNCSDTNVGSSNAPTHPSMMCPNPAAAAASASPSSLSFAAHAVVVIVVDGVEVTVVLSVHEKPPEAASAT